MPIDIQAVEPANTYEAVRFVDSIVSNYDQIRHSGSLPKAVVIRRIDRHNTISVSFYRENPSEEATSKQGVWTARMETRSGAETSVLWTSTKTCPQLYGNLVELERIALPRIEIRDHSDAPTQYEAPPPNMGQLHTSHSLWVRAWDADNVPSEIALHSLGAGSVAVWFSKAQTDLDGCWTNLEPGT